MSREDEIRDEYVNTSTYTDEGRAYQRVLEEVLDDNQRLREALEIYADIDNWGQKTVMNLYEFDSKYDAPHLHKYDEEPWEIARQALQPKEDVK